MKINCLIVDDEPIAREILETYIAQVESLRLVGKCTNAYEALTMLHSKTVDLLFLDIKMPALSGLDMIRTLDRSPAIILTTAFSEYAVESYTLGVLDYLLKPIAFERFLKAVNKFGLPKITEALTESKPVLPQTPDYVFFKADKIFHKVFYREILFVEGSGNYVKVHREAGTPLMILDKLSDLEATLPKQFIRVHKSYIVNLAQVKSLEGNCIHVGESEVPVSGLYKRKLEELIFPLK